MDKPKTWEDVERDFDREWVTQVGYSLAALPTADGLLCAYVPSADLMYRLLVELRAAAGEEPGSN